MQADKRILITGGTSAVRKELHAILAGEYIVSELADSGKLFRTLDKDGSDVAVVIMGVSAQRAEDTTNIVRLVADKRYQDMALLVFSDKEDEGVEANCIRIGAWGYIRRPFDAQVVRLLLHNALEQRDFRLYKRMMDSERFDALTGLYKKELFIKETRENLAADTKTEFAMIHFDIYKFHMFNTVHGKNDGDNLIKYIAGLFKGISKQRKPMTYCHEDADVFYICTPYHGEEELVGFFKSIRRELNLYRKDYDLLPNFGVYVIKDRSLEIQEMIGLARFASKSCKGSYLKNYSFYTKEMSDNILKEQFLLNSMNTALAQEHFVLYLQPKYELGTNTIQGAEVLVRWMDPEKGMISPGEFIPVFERNGFITELDRYIWEHACMYIHKWLEEGYDPKPISVNVSRISLYNPCLAEVIGTLVKKYEVPPRLLQLELTESAYNDNPKMLGETMNKLHKMGFTILMDDFGSGYSSLNVLKDIAVDILKIDMKFMEKSEVPGRSENILASVVRMAKWLNMPVVAEGVETADQARFLQSIGCEYVQGFYFAKPLSLAEYENRAFNDTVFRGAQNEQSEDNDQLWASNAQVELLFSNMIHPAAIMEYDGKDRVEAIRVNDAYRDLFGAGSFTNLGSSALNSVDAPYRKGIVYALKSAMKNKGAASCEFVITLQRGRRVWLEMSVKYLSRVGNSYILFVSLIDVTANKKIDRELQRYKHAVWSADKERQTVLIVEDMELNRSVLKGIFEKDYDIIEAENGQQALDIIREREYNVDIVLLDLNMPVMDGETFLKHKGQDPFMAGIPVVIISCNDSVQTQVDILSCGVDDYIVKPFVPEVVARRVRNVMESNRRLIDALRR